jgi:effector-binding domain-containing protein
VIGDPTIEWRDARSTLGIRTVTPFRGMFAVRDALSSELRRSLEVRGIADAGPYLLRYHAIDMGGEMDIEVACVVLEEHGGDERATAGALPAGEYATLTYSRYARRANEALIEWARANGVAWDRWDSDAGDTFRCRYEGYLTDQLVEPRKSHWLVELAIKIADAS